MDHSQKIAVLLKNYESVFSPEAPVGRDPLERLWLDNDRASFGDDPSPDPGPLQAKRNVLVRWQCTIGCNFACAYCWQNEERAISHKHCFDVHPVEAWLGAFDRHFGSGTRGVCLTLSGGEPTLDAKNMEVFLAELCGRGYIRNVRIDTNASWIPASFERIRDKGKIWLNCSFHPDYFTLDRYVRRIKEYRAAGFNIGMVNFVLLNHNRISFERLREALDADIPINPNPQVSGDRSYDEPTAAIFKERLPAIDYRHKYEWENPRGRLCLFPALAYSMTPFGKVAVGCHERGGSDFVGDFVADAKLPRLFEGYVPCPKDACVCSDMYTFQKGCSRNLDLNPLHSYKKALLKQAKE